MVLHTEISRSRDQPYERQEAKTGDLTVRAGGDGEPFAGRAALERRAHGAPGLVEHFHGKGSVAAGNAGPQVGENQGRTTMTE
jgi:hypothetical protein